MPNDIVKTSSDIENVDWSTGTASAHYTNVRYGSSSSQASQSSGDICRICHCESDPQNPLLTPCYCSGSLKYVHQACLQQWLTASETNSCELCKFPFIMHTKIKPFNEWRSLDMSGVERRRLCCAVLFHCAAALCVIWSLCVLIERAAEEVKRGLIGWPFWTKLVVVTVGLTGGVVFMYIQCRQYLHLCHRWRARNRILLIQNAPEKIHPLSQPSPILHSRNIPRNNSATGGCGLPLGGGLMGSGTAGMTTNGYNNYHLYGYGCQTNGDSLDGANNSVQIGQCMDGNTIDKNNYSNVPLHGQIVANIENNSSQNYDRDWNLDDSNQVSTFRPCTQGSDNTNNQSCSNSMNGSKQDLSNNIMPNLTSNISNKSCNSTKSNRTNDLDLFKTTTPNTAQSLPTTAAVNIVNGGGNCSRPVKTSVHPLATDAVGPTIVKYPNSSVFLENRDILNDGGFPKINYRHSSALTSPDITDNLDKFLGKDCRRYSDTKLLQTETVDILNPIFNVALNATSSNPDDYRFRQHQKLKSGRNGGSGGGSAIANAAGISGGEQSLMQNILGAPQITDIIFESATQLDPLELNIQEMLDMDLNQHMNYGRKKMRRSLNHVEATSKIVEDNEHYSYQDHDSQKSTEAQNQQQQYHQQQQQQQQQEPPAQTQQIDKSRVFFKSLPNLSSSCESLIKK